MKNNVYICITESLCCTVEINTILSINYPSTKILLSMTKGKQKTYPEEKSQSELDSGMTDQTGILQNNNYD